MQAFSREPHPELAEILRSEGYGVTPVTGEGLEGSISILSTVVRRRDMDDVIRRIETADPDAFVTVYEDTQIRRGWVPGSRRK